VLIECEPAIKTLIIDIDSADHNYIIEDLDEQRLVIKENMVALLKKKLDDVSLYLNTRWSSLELTTSKRLKETYRNEEELMDDSDDNL
jgi:TFIIH basal transcription factor complex TTD-A subunit